MPKLSLAHCKHRLDGPTARQTTRQTVCRAAWRCSLPLAACVLQACTSLPPAKEVSTVQLCTAQRCSDVAGTMNTAQVLQGLHQLLLRNDGLPVQLCESDPKTRQCTQDDLGYFVLGGLLPGRGSSKSITMSQVRLDAAQQRLQYRTKMAMRFLGVDLSCDEHDATLTVKSPSQISINSSEHGCNWMVVGIMTAAFGFEVDAIDLEGGRLAGWWRHRVAGTGNGQGQGYAVMQFPRALPAVAAVSMRPAASTLP